MSKQRLDRLLVERGLADSGEQARRLIMAGLVRVAGRESVKAGHLFARDAGIELAGKTRFVGRGGEKLEAAFDAFRLDVKGRTCLDVGASTGGFTDCMLQHGASRVYAVDVGRGLLHWNLRNDARVTIIEKTNARYLTPDMFPEPPHFAAIDVSFISLTKILPVVTQVLSADGEIVTLIKPQFEAGRENVRKGGVVKDPSVRAQVVETIRRFGEDRAGLRWMGVRESPLTGPAGNVEFLAHWLVPGGRGA